jgi:hypothetical protein
MTPKGPCKARSVKGQTLCVFHGGAGADQSLAARIRGGQNSAKLARALRKLPPELRNTYETLIGALEDVREGRIDATRATAMAALVRAMIALLDCARVLRKEYEGWSYVGFDAAQLFGEEDDEEDALD